MGLNTAQVYLKDLLDQLPMPNSLTLQAFITPPDPVVDYVNPHAYVWPSTGEETRLTIPRAAYPGAVSGSKCIKHAVDVFIVWFSANDDPDADTWFPGMVDAVMTALRGTPTPADVRDIYTNAESQIINTGEIMTYKIVISAVEDERFNRYDALITVHLEEIFNA